MRSSPVPRSAKRFLTALLIAAVTSFGVASYALIPELRGSVPVEQWLRDHVSVDHWLQKLGSFGQDPIHVTAPNSQGSYQTKFDQCPSFFPAQQTPVVPTMTRL